MFSIELETHSLMNKYLYPHAKFIKIRSDKDLQEFEKEFLK